MEREQNVLPNCPVCGETGTYHDRSGTYYDSSAHYWRVETDHDMCECNHPKRLHFFTPIGSVCDECRITADINDCPNYRKKDSKSNEEAALSSTGTRPAGQMEG